MKIKKKFPHKIRTIKNIWITMPDNCRLSARIWLPENSESAPVPAILEYIHYRKNDGTALRDSIYHTYSGGGIDPLAIKSFFKDATYFTVAISMPNLDINRKIKNKDKV